jgi:DNA-directed RNA polymerase specialized sigma24 family protein
MQDMPDAGVVVAARAGDREALERLVESCLPLVYNLVGRASNERVDVDDAVRQTILRTLDELARPRASNRFRSRLLTMAVRQIREGKRAAGAGPAPMMDFAEVTIRELGLTGQRREAVEATRWLEDDGREFLALWWLEVAGKLTRAELAEACDLPLAQATARVRDVENRLEAARSVVRALAATNRCAELTTLESDGDGRPSERSRNRLARHVLDCAQCRPGTTDLIPADRLLRGFALVPPPPVLTAPSLVTQVQTSPSETAAELALLPPGRAGLIAGRVRRMVVTPIAAIAVGVVVLAGGAVSYAVARPDPPASTATVRLLPDTPSVRPPTASPAPTAAAPTRTVASSPTAATRTVATSRPTRSSSAVAAPFLARHALRSVGSPGRYVREIDDLSFLASVSANSSMETKRDATFTIVTGLADSDCYSFRDRTGRYLRHSFFRVRLDADDGSNLFKKDVTFCVRIGSASGSFILQSYNYPGRYLHYRNNFELWVDPIEDSDAFLASASFNAVAPWA